MDNNVNYTCLDCHNIVEKDDNYCFNCGSLTAKGHREIYSKNKITSQGNIDKQNNKLRLLLSFFSILVILFAFIIIIRGNNLLRPLAYIEKQINSLKNGYNSSILKTDNVYNNVEVNSYEEAINLIKIDIENQDYLCSNNMDVKQLEYSLEETYNIAKVSFCDVSSDLSYKISDVIKKMYTLFPNIDGALTNITITNAPEKDEYIAYFQPMFGFANHNNNINKYNKINKTQILLNSYYFLNESMLSKNIDDVVGTNFYVKDATWVSTIAHELGHYISFKTFLKNHNIDNITYVTPDNEETINSILEEFDSQSFSKKIVMEALNNYNLKNNSNLSLDDFAKSISTYASSKNKNGNLIADETIAEAIHDYYLHQSSATLASLEIINVLRLK